VWDDDTRSRRLRRLSVCNRDHRLENKASSDTEVRMTLPWRKPDSNPRSPTGRQGRAFFTEGNELYPLPINHQGSSSISSQRYRPCNSGSANGPKRFRRKIKSVRTNAPLTRDNEWRIEGRQGREPEKQRRAAVLHASVSQAAREALGELGAEYSAWVIEPL